MSGEDFLHALILSHELQCRLACPLAVAPARCHLGHYLTGLVGAFGSRGRGWQGPAVAGAATHLGHGPRRHERWRSAGVARHHDLALDSAHAGRGGLLAARLAAQGFTCAAEPLTSPNGLLSVIGDPPNPAALTEGLGEHWECMNVAIKPFPNGCVVHAATDVCLELGRTGDFAPGDIERVELEVSPVSLQLADRRAPQDAYEAWVSLYHWGAAAPAHGRASLREASLACVTDPAVRMLSERMTARAGEDLHGDAPHFRLVGGVSDLFATGSPDLKALRRAVKDHRPSLIVIDTLAMAFPGLEENTAEGMGRVVAVARALATLGAAVILVHHGTKAEGKVPKLAALMDEEDVLACMTFPQQHRSKLHSTNPLERLNGEIKRRAEVVGIFQTRPQSPAPPAPSSSSRTTSGPSSAPRYMTLETIAPIPDDPIIGLPAMAD